MDIVQQTRINLVVYTPANDLECWEEKKKIIKTVPGQVETVKNVDRKK